MCDNKKLHACAVTHLPSDRLPVAEGYGPTGTHLALSRQG